MELNDALSSIEDIRLQINRTTRFRGYGPVTTLATAVAAIFAGFVQTTYSPQSAGYAFDVINLWAVVAVGSVAIVGVEMLRRCRQSSLQRELTLQAVEQFLPCLLLGGLLTIVLSRDESTSITLLPGLWQILFAMGLFASRRILPASVVIVGAFYATFGIINLYHAPAPDALAAWRMAVPFAIGQSASAVILYFSLDHKSEFQRAE